MIKWKLKWIVFKESGLFPRVGFMLNAGALHDAAFNEMLYGTSITQEFSRKWYNPMRWLFGRSAVRNLNPMDIKIKKFESPKQHWGKSPLEDFIKDYKKEDL